MFAVLMTAVVPMSQTFSTSSAFALVILVLAALVVIWKGAQLVARFVRRHSTADRRAVRRQLRALRRDRIAFERALRPVA